MTRLVSYNKWRKLHANVMYQLGEHRSCEMHVYRAMALDNSRHCLLGLSKTRAMHMCNSFFGSESNNITKQLRSALV